jgi:hypothetical protein
MKTLTQKACSEWLATRNIVEEPHGRPIRAPSLHVHGALPPRSLQQAAVARQLVKTCEPFGLALLHFIDWWAYTPDEMAVLCGLRTLHGDSRPLIESPGHVFDRAERDPLIGMLSLAIHYGYTAYLYFDHRDTALCWEGEILDFWCSDDSLMAHVAEMFRTHGVARRESGDA